MSAPQACQLMYYLYIRVVILGALSHYASIYRSFTRTIWRIALDAIGAKRNNRYSVASLLTKPIHSNVSYTYLSAYKKQTLNRALVFLRFVPHRRVMPFYKPAV